MSTNLAIVAIPEEQDRVWKISSEKIPHMTLLFLGDAENNSKVQQIMQFVQHATQLSEHGQFYLDVDHRGTLGDDDADVIFFSKRSWNLRWIKQFRAQLLQHEAIKTAYDSTEQFPEWLPHLTLGYPEAPAKAPEQDCDYPLYSVAFDRIAVWTGNYEGPEFRLEWPEREFDDDRVMAMSADEARMEMGLEALEHFGVKGMKWGVRKEGVKEGFRKIGRGINRAIEGLGEHFYETSIYSNATQEAIHNQVADEIDTKIYRLQTAPKYRGKNLKTDQALKTEYEQDVAKVTHSAYKRAVKDQVGENAKGTKEARFVDDARGARIEIRDKKSGEIRREADLRSVSDIAKDRLDESMAQAATDPVDAPDITIPLKTDSRGFVTSIGKVKNEIAQSMAHTAEVGEAFILEHYGVKGMRWGHRQARGAAAIGAFRKQNGPPVPVAPQANSKVPHGNRRKTKIETEGGENHPASEDAIKVAKARVKLQKSGPAALSNQDLREVAERMRLEQQVVEMNRGGTSRFIRKLFKDQGSQAAKEVVREGVKEGRSQVKDSFKK